VTILRWVWSGSERSVDHHCGRLEGQDNPGPNREAKLRIRLDGHSRHERTPHVGRQEHGGPNPTDGRDFAGEGVEGARLQGMRRDHDGGRVDGDTPPAPAVSENRDRRPGTRRGLPSFPGATPSPLRPDWVEGAPSATKRAVAPPSAPSITVPPRTFSATGGASFPQASRMTSAERRLACPATWVAAISVMPLCASSGSSASTHWIPSESTLARGSSSSRVSDRHGLLESATHAGSTQTTRSSGSMGPQNRTHAP